MTYMKKAIALAERGRDVTSPNPMVGCIIVKENRIVGEGWHKGPGQLHAEAEALQNASTLAKNADLFVNLEPCCHYGQTPPCTKAIIDAGIKRVHIAIEDPNPLVQGKGIKQLTKADIQVLLGEEKDRARKLNERFMHFIQHKTPFVTVKWAMTLDGKIASESGHSKWITGDDTREHVHRIRKSVDAVLVGAQTVKQDDPLLNVRLDQDNTIRQPLRIILDATGITSTSSKVYQTSSTLKTLVFTTSGSPIIWRSQLQSQGVDMQVFDHSPRVDLNEMLKSLGQLNITSLLVEGGASILTQFFKQNLVQKFYTYIAPKIIGGSYSPVADLGLDHMSLALRLKIDHTTQFKHDYLIQGYVR